MTRPGDAPVASGTSKSVHDWGFDGDEVARRIDLVLEGGRRMARERGEDRTRELQHVVDMAVRLLDHCSSAGITVTTDREVRTVVTTADVAEKGDQLQSELHEGPCVDAAADNVVVRVVDLRVDRRWVRWTPQAVELGVRSMLCLPLFDTDGESGALNLYSTSADAFDRRDFDVATALAAGSAITAAAAEKVDQLETALESRTWTSQAVGMLMARYRLSADDAFKLLVRLSATSNLKVAEIARRIHAQHASGELYDG